MKQCVYAVHVVSPKAHGVVSFSTVSGEMPFLTFIVPMSCQVVSRGMAIRVPLRGGNVGR